MSTSVRNAFRGIAFLSIAGLVATVAAWGQDNQAGSDRATAKDKEREKIQAAKDQKKDARDATRDARGTVREDKASGRATVIEDRASGKSTVIQDRAKARDNVIEDRANSRGTVIEDRASARDTARDDRADIRDARRDTRGARREFLGDRLRSGDFGLFLRRGGRGPIISALSQRGVITQTGLKEGDEILSVDGKTVANEHEFINQLFADHSAGKTVKVEVNRNGQPATVMLQPKSFVDEHMKAEPDRLAGYGLILDDSVPDHVKVQAVVPNSPAFYAGVQRGDRITQFNGQRIQALKDLITTIASATSGTSSMEVNRNNQQRQLDIDIPDETAEEHTRTALRPNLDNPQLLTPPASNSQPSNTQPRLNTAPNTNPNLPNNNPR